jgi:uncharacterized protein YgbK (DUF1537 family)
MIGVVADDLTGAHDIGIMFAKSGALVHVFSYKQGLTEEDIRQWQLPDVLVLDTHSRFDSPDVAYDKTFRAARLLQRLGCRQFYKKTCSVFRGNIGAEFDAMLDALNESFAGIVVGFPKNGRQTIDGLHYVHGIKLEESEFRNDPGHPMTLSSLVDILALQTERPVGLVRHSVVRLGAEHLRTEVARLRSRYAYLIFDVVDQDSLKTIANALCHLPVLGGSSALAEELPTTAKNGRIKNAGVLSSHDGMGTLCAAGSLMPQTKAQIEYMRRKGASVFELDTLQVLDDEQRFLVIDGLCRSVRKVLERGNDVVVHTSNDPAVVEQTRKLGQARGYSIAFVSRLVSETLAEIVADSVEQLGLNRFVIAGGETSGAVCARLGIEGMRVWREIEPGIPSCLSLGKTPLLLVLKSGSFGSPGFLEKAIAHLKGWGGASS